MNRIITGDIDLCDLVFAHKAIDHHIRRYGAGNVGHEVLHKVSYRGRTKYVEVTTRKTQYSACVINGKRSLQKLCYAEN